MNGSLRLGKLFGIPLQVSYTWFFIFAMVTLSLAMYYFPANYPRWSPTTYWLVGLATSLLFFGSVVAHELAHSLVARARGIPVRSITLFIFGGVASITREARRPGGELLMALVGPLTSLILAGLFSAIWLLTRGFSQPLAALTRYLGWINLSLAFFNLIPGFPLDGGRVLRSIVWWLTGDIRRATRLASLVGQGVAALFIIVGLGMAVAGRWANGLWLVFIGWFLENAAVRSYQQLVLRQALKGVTVAEVMSRDCLTVPGEMPLTRLVYDYLLGMGRRCFLVADEGRLQGLLTVHNVRGVPRSRWDEVSVAQTMTPFDALKKAAPQDEALNVLERMDEEDVNQMPVVEGGQLVGLVGRDRLLHLVRTRLALGL
jgi:Zn-dependent protease